MTKSLRSKIYIDDAGWGPQADSIEYGYRVPFSGIQVFIVKIGESEPTPDACTNTIETARCTRPAKVQPIRKCPFVGFVHGEDLEEGSMSGGETTMYSGEESSTSETESIYQLQDGGLGGCSDGDSISDSYEPPSRVAITAQSSLADPFDYNGGEPHPPSSLCPLRIAVAAVHAHCPVATHAPRPRVPHALACCRPTLRPSPPRRAHSSPPSAPAALPVTLAFPARARKRLPPLASAVAGAARCDRNPRPPPANALAGHAPRSPAAAPAAGRAPWPRARP
nr:wiskott-Aldrich syndrome protein homolog 1-like [Aegilops tauschii subsp. strangulata]